MTYIAMTKRIDGDQEVTLWAEMTGEGTEEEGAGVGVGVEVGAGAGAEAENAITGAMTVTAAIVHVLHDRPLEDSITMTKEGRNRANIRVNALPSRHFLHVSFI